MEDRARETAIDIGGGLGEYFARRARQEPDKTFLVLDYNFLNVKRKPDNLKMVKWVSDVDSSLPLEDKSIDEANINFLMGVIENKGDEDDEIYEESLLRYRRIVSDVRRCLKKGGVLKIVDSKQDIFEIDRLLRKEKFKITLKPQKLEDLNRTQFSTVFYDNHLKGRRPEKISTTLPMTIEATI
jgi:ubiquinone/menaquinone biosynthesis C-methylase UbiE